ncbi:MAG: hypothetical protein KGM24_00585 [Elusimicrobia bacterium]|nr:hypothetical protein [Elusimicrobiota bacterium]
MKTLILGAALAFAVSPAMAALTPAQLTASEQRTYQTLRSNPTAAQRFLVTRDYLRDCQKVVDHKMNALMLKYEPDDFDPSYVNNAEQRIVDKAITMNIAAMFNRSNSA